EQRLVTASLLLASASFFRSPRNRGGGRSTTLLLCSLASAFRCVYSQRGWPIPRCACVHSDAFGFFHTVRRHLRLPLGLALASVWWRSRRSFSRCPYISLWDSFSAASYLGSTST